MANVFCVSHVVYHIINQINDVWINFRILIKHTQKYHTHKSGGFRFFLDLYIDGQFACFIQLRIKFNHTNSHFSQTLCQGKCPHFESTTTTTHLFFWKSLAPSRFQAASIKICEVLNYFSFFRSYKGSPGQWLANRDIRPSHGESQLAGQPLTDSGPTTPSACLHKWGSSQGSLCACGEERKTAHIIEACILEKKIKVRIIHNPAGEEPFLCLKDFAEIN